MLIILSLHTPHHVTYQPHFHSLTGKVIRGTEREGVHVCFSVTERERDVKFVAFQSVATVRCTSQESVIQLALRKCNSSLTNGNTNAHTHIHLHYRPPAHNHTHMHANRQKQTRLSLLCKSNGKLGGRTGFQFTRIASSRHNDDLTVSLHRYIHPTTTIDRTIQDARDVLTELKVDKKCSH